MPKELGGLSDQGTVTSAPDGEEFEREVPMQIRVGRPDNERGMREEERGPAE